MIEIRARELRKGELFRTILTNREGTSLGEGKAREGVEVVLDPFPGHSMAEGKRLHPDVLVRVER